MIKCIVQNSQVTNKNEKTNQRQFRTPKKMVLEKDKKFHLIHHVIMANHGIFLMLTYSALSLSRINKV